VISDRSEPCVNDPSGRPVVFCPYCYSNLKRRGNYKGHRWYSGPGKRPYITPWWQMKREAEDLATIPGGWKCPDPHFLKLYPSLAAGMCDPWWDDKKPRKLWRISISFDAAGCALCLSDANKGRYAFTNAEDLSAALRLLEAALVAGTVSWRLNRK